MASIQVQASGTRRFRVTVSDDRGTSEHHVTVPDGYPERRGVGDAPLEELVQASFAFLLEREPRESILGEFGLTVIAGYFPEYEQSIPTHLEGTA